jgi:hypothetical protein
MRKDPKSNVRVFDFTASPSNSPNQAVLGTISAPRPPQGFHEAGRFTMKNAPRKKVPTFNHSELRLGSAELKAIRKCEAEIMVLGRRTTQETFDLGDQLNIAAALIPDRMFGKWAASVSRYSRQHLFSLMKIATVLKDHKARLVEARMSATAMGHLAGSPEHVSEVFAEFEAGRSLTTKQIQAIVGGDNEKLDTDLPNLDGVAGVNAPPPERRWLQVTA